MSVYLAAAAALREADSDTDFEKAADSVLSLIGTSDGLLELTRSAAREHHGAHPSAYMHSNGFLKIEYLRGQLTGYRVRGHFWNPAWGVVRQNPHNHAFDFRSRVVLGAFDHRHFEQMAEGEGRFHFGYQYSRTMRAGVDQYSLIKADPAWLQERNHVEIETGIDYVMHGNQLHTLDPIENGVAATAVISRPYNERPWSEIYSLDKKLDIRRRNAKLLDSNEMLEFVESVLIAGNRGTLSLNPLPVTDVLGRIR